MFERIAERVERLAGRRRRARVADLRAKLAAEAPSDVEVDADEEGVRLSGRGLVRRIALDPALRALARRRW